MTLVIEREGPSEAETVGVKTSVYCPNIQITNSQLAEHLNSKGITTNSGRSITEEEIVRRTGIHTRHWLQPLGSMPLIRSEVIPEMANYVAQEIVEKTGWQNIDHLFALHSLPYKKSLIKSVTSHLEKNCGLLIDRTFPDVYAECASSIWTLDYIRLMKSEFLGKSVLIASSEYLSPISDGLNLSLLSDGAAAMAFTYGEDLEVLGSVAKHYPDFKHLIRAPIKREYLPPEGYLFFFEVEQPRDKKNNGEPHLEMEFGEIEGPDVFAWALDQNTILSLVDESLAMAKIKPEQISLVIPHQANGRITKGLQERLSKIGIESNRVYSNIENHGNTGAVSILLAWHEAKSEGKINKGDHILLLGFGAGMTAAAAVVKVLR